MLKIKKFGLLFMMIICLFAFSGCGGSVSSNDSEEGESTDESDNTDVVSILEGTWLLHTETSGTAISTVNGVDETLTLRISTGSVIKFSEINLSGDASADSIGNTGTAQLLYSQNWNAFNEDEIFVGSFNFAISEDSISTDQSETVKIAKIDSEQWRIEENLNERNITVTINSETEINTLWNGIVNIPGLGEYRYEISCIFRKQ